jgi:hypothetical protein
MSGQSGEKAYAKLLLKAGLPASPIELNEKLLGITQQIKEYPSETASILRRYGLTPTTFRNEALAELKSYHLRIGGKV